MISNFVPVFDDEDENKLSYTEIHQQYKKLVSINVTSFITPCVNVNYEVSETASSSNRTSKSCLRFTLGGETAGELYAGGWHQRAAVPGCMHLSLCQVSIFAGILSFLCTPLDPCQLT